VTDCLFMVDYSIPGPVGCGRGLGGRAEGRGRRAPRPNICESWINVYAFHTGGDPRINTGTLNTQACNVPAAQPNDPNTAYDPQTNPGGARCDLGTYS